MKVSFDFDNTLSLKKVQEYAKGLIEFGIEVWICTARKHEKTKGIATWNDDLYAVADRLGIKREQIIFCEFRNKSDLLKDQGFLFHLDDDQIELSFIQREAKDVLPINVRGELWDSKANNAILKILHKDYEGD